jgi:tetratricopeptide (TPR) repeat protein
MQKLFYFLFLMSSLFAGCKEAGPAPDTGSQGFKEIENLSKEIANNPDNPELYLQRARFFYSKNVFDSAIRDMEKAISIDSLNPVYYHFLSDCFLDKGDGQKALKTMFRVLNLYPERVPSLLKTAEIQYILEKYDESILTINEAVKVDPQNAECYFMLGVNFRELNDLPRAINSFQTAVEMDSKLTDAWLMLGEIMENKKDKKALKYYESAVLSNPEMPEAKHALAYYLQNHDNIPKALELYREIIITHKDYVDAYVNSGVLYQELDSLDRAYEQFNIVTGIAPQNARGFYLRGLVQKKRGKKQEALKDLQTAANLDSNDPNIQKALQSLQKE